MSVKTRVTGSFIHDLPLDQGLRKIGYNQQQCIAVRCNTCDSCPFTVKAGRHVVKCCPLHHMYMNEHESSRNAMDQPSNNMKWTSHSLPRVDCRTNTCTAMLQTRMKSGELWMSKVSCSGCCRQTIPIAHRV
jgi:hypothetical protein